MAFWFRKKKQQCSGADARFLILLCLGREPHMDAECDVYTDMSVFGALKRIIASRPFGQTLFDVFTLTKGTMNTALNEDQTRVITKGLAHHFDTEINKDAASRWPHCLMAALSARRVQKAFLSEHSADHFNFLMDNLQQFTRKNTTSYVGAVHQTAGVNVRGIAFGEGQTAPLVLDFFVNGHAAGSTTADQINREIGEHLSSDGMVAFTHTLELPKALKHIGDGVLHVFEHSTGTLVCPPKEICLNPQYGAALLARTAHAVDALRTAQHDNNTEVLAALDTIGERLPALDQLSAFSLDQYDLYCQIYTAGPPPTGNGDNVRIAVMIVGDDQSDHARTTASIKAQTHKHMAVINTQTDLAGFDLLVTVPAGDVLDPHALAWFAATAASNPDAVIIRTSSDTVHTDGTRSAPNFIWQFDPLMLAQDPAYARAFAVRTSTVVATASNVSAPDLWQHVCDQHGSNGFASLSPVLWSHAADPQQKRKPLPLPAPDTVKKLAIIIPTKDALQLLRPCIESLTATLSHPATTEIIIVDNNSETDEAKQWLSTIQQSASDTSPAIRVIEDHQPFNWASINNKAAAQTDAAFLLFLNNDTLAVDKGWDSVLRSLLGLDGVGVVGAKLLYGDDTIQHAGVILNDNSLAVHEGAGAPQADAGYAGRHDITRCCSAVTGAFLGCRKSHFDAVGGFDGENFAVTFNDIDFCLTMNAAGHQCIYSPLITFYHLESKSRGYDGISPEKVARAQAEHATLRTKWADTVPHDPWYPAAFDTSTGKPFSLLQRPLNPADKSARKTVGK